MVHEVIERLAVNIQGMVQGVGFRPFIFRLAGEMGLGGWVCNSSEGVRIEVEGDRGRLKEFLDRVQKEKPSQSFIRDVQVVSLKPEGKAQFEIRLSTSGEKIASVLSDQATCSECLREVFDPQNRRYLYPFTNCIHCGPRFSIIEALPYDRANTTMKTFAMCEACRSEYKNPADRRFHAQANACAHCGPSLELWNPEGKVLAVRHEALLQTAKAIRLGKIIAVKGLGGFHFIVDARNNETVTLLRKRKRREGKPFALMFPSLQAVTNSVHTSELERSLLSSPASPIVLLRRRESSDLAFEVAPDNPYLGVMLPYTPLHYILMAELGFPVVATSGNLSEEPICTDEKDVLRRLSGIADFYLVHDRPIARHVDDSIVRVVAGREMMLRRARGYAPLPFNIESKDGPILAVGGQLKNTVTLTLGKEVVVSQHLGDLENLKSFEAFQGIIQAFQDFYKLSPKHIVCDLHPDYISNHYASQLNLNIIEVQHHHAHVASCMAEHSIEGRVLGVAWDGTGYGLDDTIWGGEFLLATRSSFERAGNFFTFMLPGGEKAIREPRRAALGLLYEIFGEGIFTTEEILLRKAFTPQEWNLFREMLAKKIQCPRTSSAGRLFDGVAALLEIRQKSEFEGQAAMELEFAAEQADHSETYSMEDSFDGSRMLFDWRLMVLEILKDRQHHLSTNTIARKFHNTLTKCILKVAKHFGEKRVVLTGGCFQNKLLAEYTVQRLQTEGFQPYWHQRIPPNDGGISLGQAAVAAERIRGRKKCV